MKSNITVAFGQEGRLNRNKEFSKTVFIKLYTDFREEQLKELKGAKLSVFMCLVLYMDDNGECFVSNKTLANKTGYSERSVKTAKKQLVDKGYLHVTKEKWTEELIQERYPNNKEKKQGLQEKIGQFASNTYSLFPENYKEEDSHSEVTSPRGKSYSDGEVSQSEVTSPRGHRSEVFAPRQKFHPKKNYKYFKKNYINNNNNNKKSQNKNFSTELNPAIIESFNMAFESSLNKLQRGKLDKYNMTDELLIRVIEWAGLGGHNTTFMFNKLDKLTEEGVKDAEQYETFQQGGKVQKYDSFDYEQDRADVSKSVRIDGIKQIEDTINKDNFKTIWENTLKYMKSQVSNKSYVTWLQGATAVGLMDNELVIEVKNSFIKDWIKERYINLLQRIVYSVCDTDVKLVIKIRKK